MPDINILQLAKSIVENTELVQKYIADNKLPEPSFAADGPTECIFTEANAEIEEARRTVIQNAWELRALMLGPIEYPLSLKNNELIGYQFITRYDIPQLVPLDLAISYEDLGKRIELPGVIVRRLIRHAISRNIFFEPVEGYVAHNAISKALATNERFHDYVALMTHELWPAATRTIDAVAKWPMSEEPNHSGFSLFNNTEKTFFQVLDDKPHRAKRFADCMSLSGEISSSSLEFTLNGYNWSGFGDGLVVDVGSSHGKLSQSLAAAHPNLRFVNQDLLPATAGVTETPEVQSGQITYMEHSFFEPQPIKDADAYILRWVLHEWADKYAIDILRNLIPALKPGARVLVIDEVIPPPKQLDPALEWRMRCQDLTMLALFNAKVREADEWMDVFKRADPRFKLQGINSPKGSLLSVMELIWEP